MVVEFTNLHDPHGSASVGSIAFAISAIIFILIPVTLIVIGFASQPTGSLLSPLPKTVVSEKDQPPAPSVVTPVNSTTAADIETPSVATRPAGPIIAADNTASPTAVDADLNSNSSDHTATISAGLTEIKVDDPEVTSDTPILITNNQGHYYIKSKGDGSFVIGTDSPSDTNRTIDYQVVTP